MWELSERPGVWQVAGVQRRSVESSSLASVGYSEEQATLEVEFRNGHVYRYFAVPKSVYDGLLTSGSKGTFLNRFVRTAYPFQRT
jgi:hypothetical protein